jgi:hypothetical protein
MMPFASQGKQQRFWRAFLKEDLSRLVPFVEFIYPPEATWPGDPTPMLNRMFPLEELEAMSKALPQPSTAESEVLGRLEELRSGRWKIFRESQSS